MREQKIKKAGVLIFLLIAQNLIWENYVLCEKPQSKKSLTNEDKKGAEKSEVKSESTNKNQGNSIKGTEQTDGVVNINTATEAELCYLPGIGPKKAIAIVNLRKQKLFKSPKEIVRVKGIGRKSLQKLLPYITVEGPTTLKGKVKVK